MQEFILRALLGGLGVAMVCGPLGCLVVWQRMAFFGAALSHAALLGIAIGLFFSINFYLSVLLVCVGMSALLMMMEKNRNVPSDTALGVLAHASLALGIVMISLMPSVRIDLMGYLFGDILSISWGDLAWIAGMIMVTIVFLITYWNTIILLIVDRELALAEGVGEQKLRLCFLGLLSLVVAVSMQIVGILLIVSLLVIPAATARRFSASPESMAIMAAIIGVLSVVLGLVSSFILDTPTGPSIVSVSAFLYAFSHLIPHKN